jgi:hypothetical protein
MRGLKSTVALFLVLVGLGAYIYFVTWKQPAEDDASKREKVFADLDVAQLEQLTVKAEAGDVTTLRKEAGAWQIVEPVKAAAAESEVTGITGALQNLEVERVVEEQPADLGTYGLSTPRVEVDFTSGAGKPSGRLLLGNKTPTGGNVYARRNDEPRVFLIPEYQQGALNKTPFDLRDKSVLKIVRDSIDGIEIAAGGKQTVFAKQGGEWQIAKPLSARADFGTVEALVGRVESAQLKSVASEQPTPADLRKYGLDKPEISVTFNAGSSRATLAIGGKAESDTVYARDLSKPVVVTIDNGLVDDLRKSVDDYRRKDVFEFRAFNATRAEFTKDGQTIVFERVKGEGENATDSWRRASPSAADADKSKVEALLAGLADIRATSFAATTANTGLDNPTLTVTVQFEEGKKQERVAFGRAGTSAYALVPNQPGAAQIETDKLEEAIKTLDELAK